MTDDAAQSRCPHCHASASGTSSACQHDCPACLRPYGVCPACHAPVRLYDYWRRPGILPPLPSALAGRKITFTVEEDLRRGEYATFDEDGHVCLLWQQGRAIEWRSCAR